MVNFAFSKGLVPVYATTSRETLERIKEDGRIETVRVFSTGCSGNIDGKYIPMIKKVNMRKNIYQFFRSWTKGR